MRIDLQNLNKELDGQFEKLISGALDLEKLGSSCLNTETSVEYEINQKTSKIFVKMATEEIPNQMPETSMFFAFCGGGKDSNRIIEVRVTPDDEEIENQIVEYVKNKKFPAVLMSGPMRVFDVIKVNGKEIS